MVDVSNNMQAGYDQVASQYAQQYLSEFDHKPIDRALLDEFAARVSDGDACDLSCGPGQLARYLHDHGVNVFGLDISPGMIKEARQAHPGIKFIQGDIRDLDLPDASLAGIAAFYSLIHLPREEVTGVLKELRRSLKPGGVLLLSFHKGNEIVHLQEFFDKPVSLDFIFFETDEMVNYLEAAGFNIEEIVERPAYLEVEYPSERVYILAANP
ncbi:MAG: class I SAM-dependent methyltransferase [Chloroflexia bacterium]